MRWKDFDFFFDNKLKFNLLLDYLVVYLGFNDFGILCGVELIYIVKCFLLCCKVLVLGMIIIWLDMLLWLYWYNVKLVSKVDVICKVVNCVVK